MATASSGSTLCEQCPDDKPPQADFYCIDCQQHLCLRCLQTHKKVPSLKKHTFVTSENAAQLTKNINNQTRHKVSNEEPISKILASRNTLEKMLEGIHITKQPWNVRSIRGSFRDIVKRMKPVKTVENLHCIPYRMGVVNGNIWIRSGEVLYNQDLNKLTEYKWQQVRCMNTTQQVSDTEVMIAGDGLHVTDTEGRYQYKVMDGCFTDITMDDNVIVIESQVNKLIFVSKKGDRWQFQSDIVVHDSDTNIKTVQLLENDKLFVAINWSHKILQLNIDTGECVQQFGTGTKSSKLGEFNGPHVVGVDEKGELIVCDGDRVKVVDSSGQWHEFQIQGVKRPRDVIVIDTNMYVLHGPYDNRQITKYQTV